MTVKFWKDYYGSLEGAVVLSFDGMSESDVGDGFPCFTVKLKNGKTSQIEISKDPEGNGGGFIFGLELPAKTAALK